MGVDPSATDGAAAALRVVVADDDALLREGLASLLENSGFDVVGKARSGPDLLSLTRDNNPDLVVVDIRMPPTNTTEGLDAARIIREELARHRHSGVVSARRSRVRDGTAGRRPRDRLLAEEPRQPT